MVRSAGTSEASSMKPLHATSLLRKGFQTVTPLQMLMEWALPVIFKPLQAATI